MRHWLGSAVCIGVCLAALGQVTGADRTANNGIPDAVVHTYHHGQSGDYFAVGLRSTESPASIRQHVILVDTSASQTGVFRERSLELVSQIVRTLPQDHRLQLFAVDTEAVSLTQGFVPVGSTEVSAALQMLKDRTPLGATHLGHALQAGLAGVGSKDATSLLYIGDGLSSAGLLQVSEVETLAKTLRNQHVSYHAVLLGPATNTELSGVLVNQTGGTLVTVIPSENVSVSEIASALQQAPVPVEQLKIASLAASLIGSNSVLLRSDRHTIVMGQGNAGKNLTLTGTDGSGTTRTWNITPQQMVASGAEIKALCDMAKSSQGLSVSVVGLQGLGRAAVELQQTVASSTALAGQLHRAGRDREALAVAKRAASLDSGNIQLTSLVTSLQQDAPAPAADAAFGSAQDSPTPAAAADLAALSEAESRIQIVTQRLSQEVNSAIDEARRTSTDLPEYSQGLLKDILSTIRDSADVSPEVRAELESRVLSAIAAVQSLREKNRIEQRQLAEREAVVESQRKLLNQTNLEEERMKTLIDQVRGLLDRARRGDANAYEDAEEVAREALELQPGDGTATAALVLSESAGQLDKIYKLVNLRHDRFLETLYQVELSHVPFPDEPPVLYPPADVWRALTLTRKPKYESVDLRSEEKAETWLRRMLKEPAPPLDYPGEVALEEVLQQISDHYTNTYGSEGGGAGADYRMTIVEDVAELELEGVTSLQDVMVKDIELKGITLKNALQLIFNQTKEPELTYMIKNEVMLITTRDAAESDENLITRVYPLGDLAISPSISMMLGGGGGGGGMMGGGMGGMGGGMGGMGGGMGGMGGGMGGMGGGMGGMGGGMFSIAAEQLQNGAHSHGISNKAVENVKKKPAIKR